MKVLIVFASKTGTTEKCAKFLSSKIEGSKLCDIRKNVPNVSDYDIVILGSYIRAGMMDRKLKKFIKDNSENLKSKKVSIFICSFSGEKDLEQNLKANVSEDILKLAVHKSGFGGDIDINRAKGIDKIISKIILKCGAPEQQKVNYELIENFANKIKSSYKKQ